MIGRVGACGDKTQEGNAWRGISRHPQIFGGNTMQERNGVTFRKPKNEAEAACFDALSKEGWTLTKRGWPDFFCIRDGEICCVEVKPHKWHGLKRNQKTVMERLAAFGIKCFKWTPDGGLEPVNAPGEA